VELIKHHSKTQKSAGETSAFRFRSTTRTKAMKAKTNSKANLGGMIMAEKAT